MSKVGDLLGLSGLFLGKQETIQASPDVEKEGKIGEYLKYLESGDYLTVAFTKVDAEGNLTVIDGDTTLFMPMDQINGKPYDLRFKAQKLSDIYCVKVIEVDESGKRVFVSHQAARAEKQPEIVTEIDRRLNLKRKSPIRIKGKVVKIQSKEEHGELIDTGVWLDLGGVGLLGYIHISNWKPTYTQELRGQVKYGDIVEVIIQEKKLRSNQTYHYVCSRKELMEDPWESKELNEKYHVGDIVRIRCLSLHSNHWFGEINGLEDIQVFTEYPSNNRNFPIIAGAEYMGKIYHMDTKERSLKARVFKALTLERLQEENIKQVE